MKKVVKELGKFREVAGVIRFGSRREGGIADIDLVLVLKSEPSEELLSFLASLPEKFDISFFHRLPPYIQFEAVKGEVLGVFDKDEFDEQILRAMRRYWELKPFYREVFGWVKKRGLKKQYRFLKGH